LPFTTCFQKMFIIYIWLRVLPYKIGSRILSASLSHAWSPPASRQPMFVTLLSGLLLYSDVPPPQHRSADWRPSGIERLAARIIISSQTPRFIVRRQRALNVFSRRCRRTLHKIARRATSSHAHCALLWNPKYSECAHCPALVAFESRTHHANLRGHLNATMFTVNCTH
jgi:hypothetical protein